MYSFIYHFNSDFTQFTCIAISLYFFSIYRFKTFPKYLVLQLAKFSFDENWVPIKFGEDLKCKFYPVSFSLDVEVDVPDALDLSSLRGTGIQPGEEELPDETASKQSDDDEGIENPHRAVKILRLYYF